MLYIIIAATAVTTGNSDKVTRASVVVVVVMVVVVVVVNLTTYCIWAYFKVKIQNWAGICQIDRERQDLNNLISKNN